jgi:putative FmdB family regulatory protein
MPRYQYECSNCGFVKTYFHGIGDVIDTCEKCEEKTMQKVFTNKFFTFNKKSQKSEKIGTLTKKYIEENKEILENEKQKAKEETYEPT